MTERASKAGCAGVKGRAAALCGNPNCGKTTLFNALTGQRQVVGNWAGVTVDKREGEVKNARTPLTLTDLPGIYSLSPYSLEEIVARDAILNGRPDVLVNIVDGTNLERNLYLTLQLLETDLPVVVAVNMMDEVQAMGGRIDCAGLTKIFGAPFVPVSARRGSGLPALLRAVDEASRHPAKAGSIPYDPDTRRALDAVADCIGRERPAARFYAAKLLEGDVRAEQTLDAARRRRVEEIRREYEIRRGGDAEAMLADARYRVIEAAARQTVKKGLRARAPTLSERIDRVVTHRVLALPIFLLVMLAMFSATFGTLSKAAGAAIQGAVDALSGAARCLLDLARPPAWTYGFLLDAVIGGVGGVLVFLPQILLLFLFLSLLEDSGYMARAAFIMDRLLRRLGLTGKSFIPMLMGFGCTTPAVMAARAMNSERDRRLTILLIPFMSCSARLPIYALFAGAFFQGYEHAAVFAMYLLGMAAAVCCGIILKSTLFREKAPPFVMELPPYRLPPLSGTIRHMWEKARGFLIKAGTVIFSMNVVIWILQSFTPDLRPAGDPSQSVFAQIGMLAAPAFEPLGFGNWRAVDALLTGLVAKESVVATLGVLYGGETGGLSAAIAGAFTPQSAVSFMVFCLLYMPCVSAFVTICREMNSVRWAAGGALLQTGTAYLTSMAVYQGLRFCTGV